MKEYAKKPSFFKDLANEVSNQTPNNMNDVYKQTGKATLIVLAASAVMVGAEAISKAIKKKKAKKGSNPKKAKA